MELCPVTNLTTEELEAQCELAASTMGIASTVWEGFSGVLEGLKKHNEAMYAHSLRVGLYALGIQANETLDTAVRWTPESHERWLAGLHLPFMGGCGHDVGKCYIPNEILNKNGKLTVEEFAVIETHPFHSWNMLKDKYPMTALVAGLHHSFSVRHYGIDFDECSPEWLTEEMRNRVVHATNLVMVCDFFDALTTRNNGAGFLEEEDSWWRVGHVLQKHFPDQKERILWLMSNLI